MTKKPENVGIEHLNDSNAFIEYSNTMDDVYEDIDDYNPNRQKKNLDRVWWHDCRHYEWQKVWSHN